MFEGYTDINDIADTCKNTIEELLGLDCNNETTLSYALAFIDDVNWYEIAEHIKENLESQ